MPALALTDHDDLGGAVRFAQAAKQLDLGGILGAELTVMIDGARTHLVVLAESREGYGNLSTLITRARMDTTRGDPAITLDTLARHTRGLFALTGCLSGWVPQRLAAGDCEGASEAVATLLDLFDGRLAIECWDHRLPEERALVRQLIPLARSFGIPWVVTNDVHYASRRPARPRRALGDSPPAPARRDGDAPAAEWRVVPAQRGPDAPPLAAGRHGPPQYVRRRRAVRVPTRGPEADIAGLFTSSGRNA
jgi:DNA polymerase III alpha subunit